MNTSLEPRAPPLAQPDPISQRVPSLPEEIIHHIIKLTYPPLSLTQGDQRSSFLHSLLLVNKSWHRLAKRELYRHLWLEYDTNATQLLAAQARTGQQLPTLSLTTPRGSLTKQLLAVTPRLQRFCYLWEKTSRSSRMYLELLAELAPNLREIVLGTLGMLDTAGFTTIFFPKLQRLALLRFADEENDESPIPMLNLDAPALESLMLRFPWRNPGVTELEKGLQTLSGQLKTLSIASEQADFSSHPFSPTFWSSLTELETLIVDEDHYLLNTLPHLPSTLQRLVIRPRPGRSTGFGALLTALQSSAPCLAWLQELHLPPVHPECASSMINELTGRRLKVTGWCAERGVQVIDIPFCPAHDLLGYFEDVLEAW